MGRALLASVGLHALAAAVAVLLGGVAGSRSATLPPVYSVQLVSSRDLAPQRTRPEPRRAEPVVEETPPEPEALEKVPDDEKAAPARPAAGRTEPSPRVGREAGPHTGPDLPLTLEGRPFAYPWYLEQLVRKVQRGWRPSTSTLAATIHFRIDRNGRIDDIEVEKSSGNFLFDQSALRAVESANPLAPLPSDYSGDWLGVYLDFDSQARLAE
jgi:TonB family protein